MMENKWIRADKLAEQWEMTPVEFVDHLESTGYIPNRLTPHDNKLNPITEIAIGNLASVYFRLDQATPISEKEAEEKKLIREILISNDPFGQENIRPLLRATKFGGGLSDAAMDAMLDLLAEDLPSEGAAASPSFTQEARSKGGRAPKKNAAIMEAVKKFIVDNPKWLGESAMFIDQRFLKKCKSQPFEITFNSMKYEIYIDGDKIVSSCKTDNKNKYHEKSISNNTFSAKYIPEAKKEIEPSLRQIT